MYDLLILNGEILDGTGAPAYKANIAVSDGKIALITEGMPEASCVIDAAGKVVSPGWIDSHSHSDASVLDYPDQREKIEQGITFSITGQCGSSAAPKRKAEGGVELASEYFERAKAVPQGSSSSMLIGFNSLRYAVLKNENRAPTPEELEKMKELLRDAMRAGAIGMSLGLIYVPGCYATTEEVIEMAKVVAEFDGLLASHIRNENGGLLSAVEEFLTVIRASGCRGVFSHHKSSKKQNWGLVKKSLAMIDAAVEEGLRVHLDVYPYTASHTSLSSTFLPNEYHPAGLKSVSELLDDRALLDRIKADRYARDGEDYSWVLVVRAKGHPEYEGKTLNEIADMRGETDRVETAFSLLRETDCSVNACYFTMCEEDVEYVIKHPRAMICTDSGNLHGRTHCHPRLRGSFPRALGRYVRERGVVSLPEMIRKMTSLPASVYRLSGKGLIKEGMDADLCIFDPAAIIDGSDFLHPTEKNEGLSYVIVDGKIAVEDGVHNGVRAGRLY